MKNVNSQGHVYTILMKILNDSYYSSTVNASSIAVYRKIGECFVVCYSYNLIISIL